MFNSKFTYRDLQLLEQASPSCPLRVVALIDFDAFYAQCEIVRLGLHPSTPLAVQQWHAIIALNYPARKKGLKRGMGVTEVKKLCPEIFLQHVATRREGELGWAYRADVREKMASDKSALDPYRQKSQQIFKTIRSLLPAVTAQSVEKASIDEVFVDLSTQVHQALVNAYPELSSCPANVNSTLPVSPCTSSTFAQDGALPDERIAADRGDDRLDWDEVALQLGADIVRRLREEVGNRFQCTCSAGIARNKMLAKLGASYRKPDQQTTISNASVAQFLALHKLTKIRGLGGKLGLQVVETFGSDKVLDILKVTLPEMRLKLGDEQGSWVYNIIRGHDSSPVNPRMQTQSMMSAKTFSPKIEGIAQAERWLLVFMEDLVGRMNDAGLETTPSRPHTITLCHFIDGRFGPCRSKQTTISPGMIIDEQSLFALSRDLLHRICSEGQPWPCRSLSVTVSGFCPVVEKNHRITSYFSRVNDDCNESSQARLVSSASGKCATRDDIEGLTETEGQNKDTGTESALENNELDAESSATEVACAALNTVVEFTDVRGGLYRCPHCAKMIESLGVLEHLDWHFARSLSAE